MRDKVEALLFAAGRFLDEEQLAKLLGADVRNVRKGLKELQELYEHRASDTSLQIVQEGNSWKLHVKDAYLELVSKLVSDKEIATTVLETLAIVAWRNPAMQAELIKIRGPAAYEHVTELIERGFITKEPEGRSFKLKVTDKFYEYFDIESREDLKGVFKNVEERAGEDQAAIDAKQAEYEAQKAKAAAAQAAIDSGQNGPAAEAPKRENSSVKSPEHSAQNQLVSLLEEIKSAAENMDTASKQAQTPTKGPTLDEIREDIDAFGKDVETLRGEEPELAKELEGENDRVPIKHHTHKPTHHAPSHKKKK